jgi:hypothetical protein
VVLLKAGGTEAPQGGQSPTILPPASDKAPQLSSTSHHWLGSMQLTPLLASVPPASDEASPPYHRLCFGLEVAGRLMRWLLSHQPR